MFYVKDFPKFNSTLNEEVDEPKRAVEGNCKHYINSYLNDYKDEDGSFNNCCINAISHITTLTSSSERNISGFCEFTNYWFYGKLKSIDKIKNYKTLLQYLFEELANFEDCEKHTEAIDDTTYSYLEILVELYEKFYGFEEASSAQDQERCEKGRKCVQDYKSHGITCKSNGNNSFCNELENFRVLFNNNLKSKNKCDNIEELPSFQGPSLAATISLPVSVMSVISFFSFITYKVVYPLGSWINPKLVKKKRPINELLHESGNRENNTNMRQYNIAYNLS
ncbi:VIR protein [Plasmodium vivax]|uniref:VIR protein n=1 Tax=Plasmodium vivax TaxID=5855 RepID=A0A1G4EC38_PLAVI|nr:VIR protein [Plasmodium vivax]